MDSRTVSLKSHDCCGRVMTLVTMMTLLAMTSVVEEVAGHGRMMDPPARNSMWRLGFNNPVNYNDNELYCGGRMVQWIRNGGKCGVCGDAYHGHRNHEAGGKYANGIIARTFSQGDVMPITVHLTANHQGWFEIRVCPVNDPKIAATQECLDRHLLQRADGGGAQFPVPKGKYNAFFNYSVQLPPDLTCSQCVVQWKYRTGNTWDKDDNSGVFCLGCGPQEEFYNCADIAILPDKTTKSKISQQSQSNTVPQTKQQPQHSPKNHNKDIKPPKTNKERKLDVANNDHKMPTAKQVENTAKNPQVKKEFHVMMKEDTEVRKSHKPRDNSYRWHAASSLGWAMSPKWPASARAASATAPQSSARPTATSKPFRSPYTPPAGMRRGLMRRGKGERRRVLGSARPTDSSGEMERVARVPTEFSTTTSVPVTTTIPTATTAASTATIAASTTTATATTSTTTSSTTATSSTTITTTTTTPTTTTTIPTTTTTITTTTPTSTTTTTTTPTTTTSPTTTTTTTVPTTTKTTSEKKRGVSKTRTASGRFRWRGVLPNWLVKMTGRAQKGQREQGKRARAQRTSTQKTTPQKTTTRKTTTSQRTTASHTTTRMTTPQTAPTPKPTEKTIKQRTIKQRTTELKTRSRVRSRLNAKARSGKNLWRHLRKPEPRRGDVTVTGQQPRTTTPQPSTTIATTKVDPNCTKVTNKEKASTTNPPYISHPASRDNEARDQNNYNFRQFIPRVDNTRHTQSRDEYYHRNPTPNAVTDTGLTSRRRPVHGLLQTLRPLSFTNPIPLRRSDDTRWWQGYDSMLWTSVPRRRSPSLVGTLQCRATVRLGGGMDEWCTSNCNANYCPAGMCVCQHSEDSFSPSYDLVHPASWIQPYKSAISRTTYSALSPLLPSRSEIGLNSASRLSIFAPHSDSFYEEPEPVRNPFAATYSTGSRTEWEGKRTNRRFHEGHDASGVEANDVEHTSYDVKAAWANHEAEERTYETNNLVTSWNHKKAEERRFGRGRVRGSWNRRVEKRRRADGEGVLAVGWGIPREAERGYGGSSRNVLRRWNVRKPVCRATGHYAGMPHYDAWCSSNCAQAMCPLLMCTCDSF